MAAINARLHLIRPTRKHALWLLLRNSNDKGVVHQAVTSQPIDITSDSSLKIVLAGQQRVSLTELLGFGNSIWSPVHHSAVDVE